MPDHRRRYRCILVLGDKSERFAITRPVAAEKQSRSYVYEPCSEGVAIHSGRIKWFCRSPDWKDVAGFRGTQDFKKPVGEWNKMECINSGDTLSVKLNGVVVNQKFYVKPSKGRIQIQSGVAEINLRRVDLIDFKFNFLILSDEQK